MGAKEIDIAGNKFIIHELDNVYDPVTGHILTGSWLWDSALVLAQYISTHLHFKGKSVLELGSGAGLPGLTAASLGATKVLLTDIKQLLTGLVCNVEANGLGDRVEVRELVWGSDELELGDFDFVLMSDVFFDPEEMVGLAKTLKEVCGRETGVWAASEVRSSTGECLNELTREGFEVIEFPGEDKSFQRLAVYQIIPPIRN